MRHEAEFTEKELAYLKSQKIGRLATVSLKSVPHVVPVVFTLRDGRISFGGRGLEQSLKYRHLKNNRNVAFVVDSLKVSPWSPIGIEIRGISNIIAIENGEKIVEIIPQKIVSWGLDPDRISQT